MLNERAADDLDVVALLDESEAWVTKLTSDEIEALHWYSMGGYEEINGGFSNPNRKGSPDGAGGFKIAAPAKTIELLDSALNNVDSSKQAVVYRRHFFYDKQDPENTFASRSFEEQAAHFPVGSVYKPSFFMSTSLNPSNIGMPMRKEGKSFMVRLEILTRRGAAMPAVSNGATSEQEILLPRDGAYRVVNNDHRISVNSHGEVEQVRVIQLQELEVEAQ